MGGSGFFGLYRSLRKSKYSIGRKKKKQSIIVHVQDNGIGIEKILGYHFSHFQASALLTNMEVERVLG